MADKQVYEADVESKGRPLGAYETFSACLSGMHSSGIYWHAAVINTSHPLQDDDVITACKVLVRKQEVLQMRIVHTDPVLETALHFRFTPMENLEKIDFESVTFKNKDDWPMYISTDHDERKIDIVNGPLWRIILGRVEVADDSEEFLYQYIILLKFVHTIVDGLSAFDLLNRQFLPILSALINGGDAENVIPFIHQTNSAGEIFPQAKKSVSWCSKLEVDFLRWKNRTFKPAEYPVYMFTDEAPSLNAELTKEAPCIPKIFGEEICGPVIESARKHGVTVHCILLSAGAIALSRTAKLSGVKLPGSFTQMWPISLRKFLDFKSPQPLAFFGAEGITVHETMTDYTVDDFWRSCKKIQTQVKKESKKEKCIQNVRGINYFLDAAEKTDILTVLSEMGLPPSLFLSNLGNTSADPDVNIAEGPMKMRVTEQYFNLTGLGVTNCCPLYQFMLTFEKRFMWNISYNPKKVSRRFVQTYLETLEDVLKIFCKDENEVKDL